MKQICFGIIGVGYWGPNYIRNLNDIPDAIVKYICDLDKRKLEDLNKRYPDIMTTLDYREILDDDEIDAVIISIPTKMHFQIARDCLLKRKNVLVEKPMATSADEALELVEISKKQRRVLMVGHIFEYNNAVNYIKQSIKEKSLGDVLYTHSSRTGLGPVRNDVNVIWDLASHDISILLYVMDQKPIKVIAKGESYIKKNIEDVVFITLEFEGNIVANIHVSWLDPVKTRKFTIVGTKKMLVFDDVSQNEKIKIFDKGVSYEHPGGTFGDFQLLVRDGDILIPKIKFSEPLKEQCKHFIECIHRGCKPLSDGEDGYNVVKILEAIQTSLQNGSKVVNIK
jgi:predicted dehydrogenase